MLSQCGRSGDWGFAGAALLVGGTLAIVPAIALFGLGSGKPGVDVQVSPTGVGGRF
jgi:hypothetical protein